jgi:hypothetical protein
VWDDKIVNDVVTLIDKRASTLVGILLRRVEILAEKGSLTPELYKSLAKESVYENFRELKQSIVPKLLPHIECK